MMERILMLQQLVKTGNDYEAGDQRSSAIFYDEQGQSSNIDAE